MITKKKSAVKIRVTIFILLKLFHTHTCARTHTYVRVLTKVNDLFARLDPTHNTNISGSKPTTHGVTFLSGKSAAYYSTHMAWGTH